MKNKIINYSLLFSLVGTCIQFETVQPSFSPSCLHQFLFINVKNKLFFPTNTSAAWAGNKDPPTGWNIYTFFKIYLITLSC